MRFTKQFWPGIERGTITLAFRRWKAARVVEGRVYRSAAGRLEVLSVSEIDPAHITDADADRSGHRSGDDIRGQLRGEAGWPVYRIEFRRIDEEDPRAILARTADLDDADRAEIDRRLDRLDRASNHGAWTRDTLRLIADHPRRRAPDLAEMVGREAAPFKLDVRKLKNLGLTLSFNPGYTLSPRGAAYLGLPFEGDD